MNIEQLKIKIGQRDGKLTKRTVIGKMGRFGETEKSKKKRTKTSNKREWLYSKEVHE